MKQKSNMDTYNKDDLKLDKQKPEYTEWEAIAWESATIRNEITNEYFNLIYSSIKAL